MPTVDTIHVKIKTDLIPSDSLTAYLEAQGWRKPEDARPEITIKKPDDRTLEIWLNGEHVGGTDYDESGWGGIAAMEGIVRAIAEAADIQLKDD